MTEQELILTSVLNCRRVDLYAGPVHLSDDQEKTYAAIERRRHAGEPIQYILGECEFYGLKLRVDPRVLIPRPETELLVDFVIKSQSDRSREPINILDLGTGSGNIAITLAKNFTRSSVITVDISNDALDLARCNAQSHGVESKINFIHQDLNAFFKEPIGKSTFDIIISNPPYIPTAHLKELPRNVQFEPKLALNGGEDGLDFYRQIIPNSFRLLKPEGFLFLEIGDGQTSDILKMFEKDLRFKKIEVLKDWSNRERFIKAQV